MQGTIRFKSVKRSHMLWKYGSVFRQKFGNLQIFLVGRPPLRTFPKHYDGCKSGSVFLFSLLCWFGFINPLLWCGSGSCSSWKWCKSATTSLQTLHGSILSLHAYIVSDEHPRPSIAPLWASTAPEFWFWCGSDPDPALDFDADPDPLPKMIEILADLDAQHCTKENITHGRQSKIFCVLGVTCLRKLRHCATV